ncbi:MAG: hypothetical protein LQ341_000166 [Variospora aurantia]|nr:MAG: hypothetical protein LQ341_000166 [Variospora aurantia]
MMDIPLPELADTIRRRVLAGNFNVDVFNSHLHPVAELTVIQDSAPASTPAATPQKLIPSHDDLSQHQFRSRSHSLNRPRPQSSPHSDRRPPSPRSPTSSQPRIRSRSSSSTSSDSSAGLGTRLAAIITHARQNPAVHPSERATPPYPTPHDSTNASSPSVPSDPTPLTTQVVSTPDPAYPASLSSHSKSRSSRHSIPRSSRHSKLVPSTTEPTTSCSRFRQTRGSTSKRRRVMDRNEAGGTDAGITRARGTGAGSQDAVAQDAPGSQGAVAQDAAGSQDAGGTDAGSPDVGTKGAVAQNSVAQDAAGSQDVVAQDVVAQDAGTRSAGTKDAESNIVEAKAKTQASPQQLPSKDTSSPELHEMALQAMAKRKFMAKWEKRTFDHAALDRLSRFITVASYINRRPQEPFRELDKMMELISDFGSLEVQQGFAANLRLWMGSDDRVLPSLEPPAHLSTLEPGKRETFQRLWRATHITEFRSGKTDINGLLLRLSIVKEMTVYNETIDFLKKNPDPRLNLRKGQSVAAKTRELIYETMYPQHLEATSKRSAFNRKQTLARPYMALQKQYRNEGIFAMVPSLLSDNTIAGTPRIAVLLEALELLRPDFHSDRLKFYSRIVNLLYTGNVPSDLDMQLLERWSRADCRALRLGAFKKDDASLIAHFDEYPVDGMYISVEDRDNHAQMGVLDREELLASRIANRNWDG